MLFNILYNSVAAWTVPQIIISVVVGAVIAGVFFMILSIVVASYCVYRATLCRTKKEKWGRLEEAIEPQQRDMYREGLAWGEKNKEYMHPVHIQNNGLNLYGEYYDFGCDRCVMILSGRTESLRYGYYFAIPYSKIGFNVLVVDPRAHGESDGKYNTIGFDESTDDIAWVKFLRDEYNMNTIIFHGICIGAAGGLYAALSEECSNYVKGIVAEGMYANFGESMKNHLIERNKPVGLVYPLIKFWMKLHTGHDMDFGPIDVIHKLDKPLLMIHSKEDAYSTPEYAQKLYDACLSKHKTLSWHSRGAHSMLRPTDTELYDEAIKKFVSEIFDK